MNLQHDLGRLLPPLAEELLQNADHELHRRVIVVQQHHLVHRWRLDARSLLLDDGAFIRPLTHLAAFYSNRPPETGYKKRTNHMVNQYTKRRFQACRNCTAQTENDSEKCGRCPAMTLSRLTPLAAISMTALVPCFGVRTT